MRKGLRKTLTALCTVSLLTFSFAGVTSAGSTDSYYLDGKLAQGSLVYSSSTYSVSASTTYQTTAGLYAYASYTSRFGGDRDLYTVDGSNSNASTLVVTTVSAPYQPSVFVSAFGSHIVSYNGGTWTGATDLQ